MALNTVEKRILSGVLAAVGLFIVGSSVFVVDESEYAVVLRFGRVVAEIEQPGLQVKLPAPIDQVRRFDKRVLYQGVAQTEFLSADKKNVLVSSYLTWRIRSPRLFLEALHFFAVRNITWRALPERFGKWNTVWKRFDQLRARPRLS